MGNGDRAKGNVVGELIGTENNKKVKISYVVYCPKAKFNLFSIALMLNKERKLRGNDKGMEVSFGHDEKKKKMRFNIKSKTSKGVLYCMRIKLDRDKEEASALADNKDVQGNDK